MFQGWRFKLREAEEALEQGQLGEAQRFLIDGDLRQYLPGKRLATRVAGRLAERARQRVVHGEATAGWSDLEQATALAGEIDSILAARQEIVALALGEAENHIVSGDPARAISLLESLERHGVNNESIKLYMEAARRFESAQHLASRGKFGEAEQQVAAAEAICPHLAKASSRRQEYRNQVDPFRDLTEQLHRSVADEQWSDVLQTAERLLDMAPVNRLARDMRRRAWAKVGARFRDSHSPPPGQAARAVLSGPPADSASPRLAPTVTISDDATGPRFLLWVDGVGGYLVCMGSEVMLGQASPLYHVDIPIQADVSRQHAKICRLGEGYVIVPLQATAINGQPVRGKTLLSDGDEIELAGTVRLRFRQPHALSASARLDFVSHHRTRPTADAVLLMAESCVLGPKWQNHVVCRDWDKDVVLYRRDGDLFCRAMDSIEIDGRLCDGRGNLSLQSHVAGNDFSMSLEELS